MTKYATSRVMYNVTRDGALAEQFQEAPGSVLGGYDLTDQERAALAAQDVRALFELGIHPFVLYHFALRLAGGFSMPFIQHYLGALQGLTMGDLET